MPNFEITPEITSERMRYNHTHTHRCSIMPIMIDVCLNKLEWRRNTLLYYCPVLCQRCCNCGAPTSNKHRKKAKKLPKLSCKECKARYCSVCSATEAVVDKHDRLCFPSTLLRSKLLELAGSFIHNHCYTHLDLNRTRCMYILKPYKHF